MTATEAMAWIRQHGRVQRGQRYPREVVAAVATHVRAQRELGVSWEQLQKETGLGSAPLKRWADSEGERTPGPMAAAAVRPVRVEVRGASLSSGGAGSLLQLKLPGGAVVDGLSIHDVGTLLRGFVR
jgi:hypothetical protein